jgi:hypothetical protein
MLDIKRMLLGAMRYRGGGGGGGGGGGDGGDGDGDGGDSGDSGIGDSGDVGDTPGMAPSDIGDTSISDIGTTPTGIPSDNSNGIAGMMGIDNPTIASIVNGVIGMAANAAVPGLGGIAVGMTNAAINGNPASAASGMGQAVASAAGIPGVVGSVVGNAIGNMSGVPAASVPGDPTGGGSGMQTLSGGLGMAPNTQNGVVGGGSIGASTTPTSTPTSQAPVQPYSNDKLITYLLNRDKTPAELAKKTPGTEDTNYLVQALRGPAANVQRFV